MPGAGWEQRDGRVGEPDVAEVRALLRRDEVASRRAALARIRGWDGAALDQRAADAVLRAVTVAYPWVAGERIDPADLLVRLLWSCPTLVTPEEVEAAYHVAGERVRRSLLHLLALRGDRPGLDAVVFLLGADAPAGLLPAASSALLDPLLALGDLGPLPVALARVAARPGWAWHASDLLRRLVRDGRLAGDELDRVVAELAPTVTQLADAVDRGAPVLPHLAGIDITREDRRRLTSLVRFLEAVPTPAAGRLLLRVLGSADARAAAPAAAALCAQLAPVAPERLELIARDPEARALLLDGLDDLGLAELVPARQRDGVSRAEADLVRWLADDTELGAAPHELELAGTRPLDGGDGTSAPPGAAGSGATDPTLVHLFRFRLRSPHWSCSRGWMIGAAGCFTPEGDRSGVPFVHSLYRAEDEMSLADHLDAIRTAAVDR